MLGLSEKSDRRLDLLAGLGQVMFLSQNLIRAFSASAAIKNNETIDC